MKIAFILICFSFLFAGCTSARVKNQKSLGRVTAEYRLIAQGMTEEDVVARLGAPNKTDQTGNLHWRQEWPGLQNVSDGFGGTYTEEHYVDLSVAFDGTQRVRETKVHSGTDHFPNPSDLPSR